MKVERVLALRENGKDRGQIRILISSAEKKLKHILQCDRFCMDLELYRSDFYNQNIVNLLCKFKGNAAW